jgi:uncharacterized MAPEG superfamily protein
MDDFPLTTLAVLIALLVYILSMFKVGGARRKFGVKVPATTGNEDFERVFRGQQNTVEQLVIFLPLIVIAANVWGDLWAAVYGFVWSLGRLLYITGYAIEAKKRELGFMLSGGLSLLVLIAVIVTYALKHLGV